MKRELRSTDESGMLTSCLDVQASAERTQTKSRRESLRLQPASLRQRLNGRRIPPLSRSANWAGVRAGRYALNGSRRIGAARLPKKRRRCAGAWAERRLSRCPWGFAVLPFYPMPSRTAGKNRQIQGDGLLAPKIAKKKIAAVGKTKRPREEKYFASISPGSEVALPKEFGKKIIELEKLLNVPIWVIIHQGQCPNCGAGMEIELDLFKGFQSDYAKIPGGRPIGLLLESPGGDAHTAYRIARLLQRRSENRLTVIVPQYAKSAATLLALGASRLIVSENAEFGPLDVQIPDPQKEEIRSALDVVQSLQQLREFALVALDQTMALVVPRTFKKTDTILPHAMKYVTDFMCPLLEQVDVVDYTGKSRELKVAEDYAVRLMIKNYDPGEAQQIAKSLVAAYPTHGFVIDKEEAQGNSHGIGLGLKMYSLGDKTRQFEQIVADLIPFLDRFSNVAGRITTRR
jgi:hypothetical protein